jgi:hypothetical protein
MKKTNFLKLAFLTVAMFAITGSFAQGVVTDYALITADASNTYVTQTKAIPVYVKPDPLYHPTWVFPSTNLTAGFTWVFTSADITGGNIALTQPSSLNYATLTGVNIGGPYAVNVKEQSGGAFGGCSDAGLNFNVFVVTRPSAGITGAAAGAGWVTDLASYNFHRCGDALAENLSVTITEVGAPALLASYAFAIEKRTVNIDVSNVEIPASVVTTNLVNYPTPVGSKYKTTTADGGVLSVSTGALTVLNSLRTKYQFTLKKTPLVAGADGIVSGISHRSDYVAANGAPTLAQITTYPFTGTVIVEYIVNPSPTTGPIYHIPNNYAY